MYLSAQRLINGFNSIETIQSMLPDQSKIKLDKNDNNITKNHQMFGN